MIIVITYTDKETNEIMVSHGIDIDNNDKFVVLPEIPIQWMNDAEFDSDIREYVIYDT